MPDGRPAKHMRDALEKTVQSLPQYLTRSLTRNQGSEIAAHHAFSFATVATELNGRSGKALGWEATAERLRKTTRSLTRPRVATIPGRRMLVGSSAQHPIAMRGAM
ncbi:hypothetical protein ACFYQ5_12575 [Streptomyces sp. NPDC005794]|uniref:hypothetical protein n=1 Tax=Streptomyces sp. NPDC005794 TaxID=3364733 RepID=UPI0036842DB9